MALGHGVSAQQGVLKVAHSDTLGGLWPRLWRVTLTECELSVVRAELEYIDTAQSDEHRTD